MVSAGGKEDHVSLIDWDRLAALRNDIGEENFADVALLFVAEIDETLARLSSEPGRATAADFHFLRGSASNLGFAALTDACLAAEAACAAGRAPDIPGVAAAFHAALDEAAPRMPELARAA